MFVLDSLLAGGLRFVLQTVADVADREMNDPERWRSALLEAQLDLESGRISAAEFAARERDILARLREIRPAGPGGGIVARGDSLEGIDVVAGFDEPRTPRR